MTLKISTNPFYTCTIDGYTFAIICNKKNIVIRTAPCAKWMIGKSMVDGGQLKIHIESIGTLSLYN